MDPGPDSILVTGGAGFVGSNLIRLLLQETSARIHCLDALTYAGNPASLPGNEEARFQFHKVDLSNREEIGIAISRIRPRQIYHLAAETHVDRSIDDPDPFVQANFLGTYHLAEAVRAFLATAPKALTQAFRFLQVSTDEVFGSIGGEGVFTENTAYAPRSPYAATKAAADHLLQAWHHTYGFPVLFSHSSNNYGPFQHPEKFIPHVINRALREEPVPVYGRGEARRDWLFVEDHNRALLKIMAHGRPGDHYLVASGEEHSNLTVAKSICACLDRIRPLADHQCHEKFITFVADRPGHDFRYALDTRRMKTETGWKPQVAFTDGLRRTIEWYLENPQWMRAVRARGYRMERLGLGGARR